MMKKVAVAAKVPAAPGKGAELAAALQFALDNVVSENGTLLYILHADATDPDTLWMYELYESQDDLTSHMGSDWFKQLGPKMAPLMGLVVRLPSNVLWMVTRYTLVSSTNQMIWLEKSSP